MSSPAGYRMAHKLMSLAEHFEIPVFTLIDTVGAFPSFESEQEGQSEAIATNLSKMVHRRDLKCCLIVFRLVSPFLSFLLFLEKVEVEVLLLLVWEIELL